MIILVSSMVMRKETILTQGYQLFLNAFQLFEFHTVEAYCSLGLARVKEGNNKLSAVDKE
jgi:hypothetical protein